MAGMLESSFYVRAKLSTTLRRASESLSGALAAAQKSDGTRSTFSIEKNAELILEKGLIVYRFRFEKAESATYCRNLSIFLALLSLLKEDYTVNGSDLFPYMAEALRWSMHVQPRTANKNQDELLAALTENNLRLASNAIASWNAMAVLQRDVGTYKELSGELVEKLCGLKVNGKNAELCSSKLKQVGVNGADAETLAALGV